MPVWMMIVPVLFPFLAGGGLLIFPVQKRGPRNIYVSSAVLINALLALAVLIWPPSEAFDLIRFSGAMSISFMIDGASRIFGFIVTLLWPLTTLYSFEYMEREGGENKFFGFFIISFGVVLGIAFSQNFLTLYFFYELLTLATLPLVMHSMDDKARYAGKKYLIYSVSGAAFAFIAMIFLISYGTTLNFTFGGVLDPEKIAGKENLLRAVFVLGFFGFGVKAAVFPFHGWLPDASVAPTPVSALLHAVAVVKAGAFAVIRLSFYGFGCDFLKGSWAQTVMMLSSVITIIYGSAMALRTPHLKRRLAYSTVSNLSYILFSVSLLTNSGLAAGFVHMVYHAVIKITLFFCAGAVLSVTGKEYVYDLDGFGQSTVDFITRND